MHSYAVLKHFRHAFMEKQKQKNDIQSFSLKTRAVNRLSSRACFTICNMLQLPIGISLLPLIEFVQKGKPAMTLFFLLQQKVYS